LARAGASNGVGDTNTVHTDLVYGAVDREEVDKVTAKRILTRETNLETLRLDELNDLDGSLQLVGGSADDNVDTIDTSLDGQAGVIHVAAHVSQDLGLETELADGLAVPTGLFAVFQARQLDVVDAEVIESLGNLDLSLGVEEGVGKLLALTESGLDCGRKVRHGRHQGRGRGWP
ncbi:hypothetical protein BN1708_006226, partial [Verticillium longisporum]